MHAHTLIYPGDRHPLGLGAQVLHGLTQLPKGVLQVVIGQAQVKVMAVAMLYATALLYCPPGISLLPTPVLPQFPHSFHLPTPTALHPLSQAPTESCLIATPLSSAARFMARRVSALGASMNTT